MKINKPLTYLSVASLATTLALTVSGCSNKQSPTPPEQLATNEPGSQGAIPEISLPLASWIYPSTELLDSGNCRPDEQLLSIPSLERATSCLAQICNATPGAAFNGLAQECECDDGSAFTIENNQGRCVTFNAKNAMEGKNGDGNYLRGDQALLSVTDDLSPFTSQAEQLIRDEITRNTIDHGKIYTPVYYPKKVVNFTVGASQKTEPETRASWAHFSLRDALERGKPEAFPDALKSGEVTTLVGFEPTLQLLGAALKVRGAIDKLSAAQKNEFENIANTLPSGERLSSQQETARASYESYRKAISKHLKITKQESVSLSGCAESCQVTYEIPSPASSPNVIVELKKSFVNGNVISRKVVVTDISNKTIIATLLLNPAGTVSVIGLQTKSGVEFHLNMRDRNWNSLNLWNFTQLDRSPEPQEQIEKIKKHTTPYLNQLDLANQGKDGAIVLCESRSAAFSAAAQEKDASAFLGNILRGPESSLLGWTPESESNSVSGHDTLLSWGAANDSEIPAIHLAASLMGPNQRNLIIPIPQSHCLNPDSVTRWRRDAQQSNARVIVFPTTYRLSAETQFEANPRVATSLVTGKNNRSLWILAAGDDGERNPRLAYPANAFRNHSSTLVVAALETQPMLQDKIAKNSNRGTHHADIAAEPRNALSQENWLNVGSALATANVAVATNEVMTYHPTLRAPLVRLSILLGARIPQNGTGQFTPLDVRSGGILDLTTALKISDSIKDLERRDQDQLLNGSNDIALKVLSSVYCTGQITCDFAQEKTKFLIHTGVLK